MALLVCLYVSSLFQVNYEIYIYIFGLCVFNYHDLDLLSIFANMKEQNPQLTESQRYVGMPYKVYKNHIIIDKRYRYCFEMKNKIKSM